MLANKSMTRVGVAAIAFGLVTGAQTVGVASADTADAGSATESNGQPASQRSAPQRSSRAAKSGASSAAGRAARGGNDAPNAAASVARRTAAVDSGPDRVPNSVASTLGGGPSAALVGAPAPSDTVETQWGTLGKWMINKDNQIANWLGKPQPVNTDTGTGTCPPCTPKTILEGVNVVFVDTASATTQQAIRNLNVWLRQTGFGASAISSTGYQGLVNGTLFSQQPTSPSQAFRNSFFLFANSHARVFGPYKTDNGYVWTSSFSEENWSIKNPLTHGYQSFDVAQTQVTNGVLNGPLKFYAQDLGRIDMQNQYNVGDFSTGDASGYAQVLGLNRLLKAATGPRGASK